MTHTSMCFSPLRKPVNRIMDVPKMEAKLEENSKYFGSVSNTMDNAITKLDNTAHSVTTCIDEPHSELETIYSLVYPLPGET